MNDEILTHIDSVPEFRYRINVTGKTSRECYVHYNSNRYSIPWKYAGRECTVKGEKGKIRISIDSEIIEHDILPGTGRISRKCEHFESLLEAVKDQNVRNYYIYVEKRYLNHYEEVK